MNKFVKVLFGTTSGADKDLEYKIGEVNVANNWNPNAEKGREFGGFNYATEDCILRWLHRGNVVYDVEIPEDAENIKLEGATTIYRANKIIISNPKKITDEMALDFYKKSNIPEISYYKALAVVSIMGYTKTAIQIFRDKVNKENIDLVLAEWNDFMRKGGRNEINDTVKLINEYLLEVKSDLLISITIDKAPFIKEITNEKVLNITGESGSGKSYYSNKYVNDDNYIVIDTDLVFGDSLTQDKYNLELRELFKHKEKDYLIKNFDDCYSEILNCFGDIEKTIVIDSAQFRNIKDYSILKGKIIVMRTCVDTCYNRCITRWKNTMKDYTKEELETYSNRKLGMYKWYKSLNKFLENISNYDYETRK
ncbi:MAG: hypothetical protein E7166_06505 [Firmicutes bacterium]|nr:hypothetical protein [Bacillota bacterium]